MAKTKIDARLSSADKGMSKAYGTNGVLSRGFGQILVDLNIGPARFGSLLQDYVLDTRYGVPDNRKEQTSMRGNLRKEFAKPQMTWKVFCKAIRFLQVWRMEVTFKLYHDNNDITSHTVPVNLGRRKDTKQFLDELDQPEENEGVFSVPALEPDGVEVRKE